MAGKMTQQKIANSLGLSRLTVSKAMSGAPGVSEKTRRTVMRAAAELGYKSARPSEPFYRRSVSLLTYPGFVTDSYWSALIEGITLALAEAECDLNICFVRRERALLCLPSNFDAASCTGVILLGDFPREEAEYVKTLGAPLVSIDAPHDVGDDALLTDTLLATNSLCVCELVKLLAADGRQSIAFMGEAATCRSLEERRSGYRQGLRHAGMKLRSRLCFYPPQGEKMNAELIYEWVRGAEKLPDAVVCANDFIALTLMDALAERGARVPEDVAVCGFDDLPESQRRGLTTVRIHKREMGMRAVEELLWRADRPDRPYEIVRIPAQLMLRASTGTAGG